MNPIMLRKSLNLLSADHHLTPNWIRNRAVATWISQLIPAQCPFARRISVFGLSFRIPPLCKLNPFYDQLMSLRFQALCVLEES